MGRLFANFNGITPPIFKGETSTGDEVEGYLVVTEKDIPLILPRKNPAFLPDGTNVICSKRYAVIPDSICQYTGVCDQNGEMLFIGDTVEFFGIVGTVYFAYGAFGISFQEYIDWGKIAAAIPEYTGCDNDLDACQRQLLALPKRSGACD